jgi:hypothetical protein
MPDTMTGVGRFVPQQFTHSNQTKQGEVRYGLP